MVATETTYKPIAIVMLYTILSRQTITITYATNGQTKRTSVEGDLGKSLGLGGVISSRSSWTNVDTINVLSPSEKPQSAEWIDQGHEDAVRFACKKRSYEQLKEQGFVGLVDKWFAKSKENA